MGLVGGTEGGTGGWDWLVGLREGLFGGTEEGTEGGTGWWDYW